MPMKKFPNLVVVTFFKSYTQIHATLTPKTTTQNKQHDLENNNSLNQKY